MKRTLAVLLGAAWLGLSLSACDSAEASLLNGPESETVTI